VKDLICEVSEMKVLSPVFLEENQGRNLELLDKEVELVCIHDLEGKLQYLNKAVLDAQGYESEEMIGH